MKNNTLRVGEQLAEGALTLLLEQLNLTNFFKRPRCDRNRGPYIPAVQGLHNGTVPIIMIKHVPLLCSSKSNDIIYDHMTTSLLKIA